MLAMLHQIKIKKELIDTIDLDSLIEGFFLQSVVKALKQIVIEMLSV